MGDRVAQYAGLTRHPSLPAVNTHHSTAETAVDMALKASPPASVSIATLAGIQVSEILMWATLVYTLLMIGHKLVSIWREVRLARCGVCEGREG